MNTKQLLKGMLAVARSIAGYLRWAGHSRSQDTKRRVNVDDIDIFFRRYGSGDPVLLLHGGFMFAETWAGQIPALSRRYLLIAPDARGHGRTTLGSRPMTYRRLADDAAGLIEDLGLGPVHVIGWSDGGCTALGIAVKRPDLLRSITLLGTPWNVSNYSDEVIGDLISLTDPTKPATMALRLLRWLLTPEHYRGKESLGALRDMWLYTLDFTLDELNGITTPTLVLATDSDEFLSPPDDPTRIFRELAEAIPGATMATIPGGTHLVHLIQPDIVNGTILDFFKSPLLPSQA